MSRGVRPTAVLATVALLLIALAPAAAMYDANDAVEELTADNFEEEVLDSEDFWMVEFYAPWCGHCQKLTPEWKKAAKELEGVARLGAVDCDDADNKGLCSDQGVKGFPTIKVFGEDKKSPSDYKQAREASAIVNFVKEAAGPGAASSKLIAAPSYLETYWFLHEDKTPKVILLTDGEPKAPAWLSTLAVKYKDGRTKSVKFAHVDTGKNPQVARNLKVESFPTLVVARITGSYKEGSGVYRLFPDIGSGKGSEAVKMGKEAVDTVALDEDFDEETLNALPAFPPPETPKKLAPTSFHRLDSDNADTKCFGGDKPICVLALVAPNGKDDFAEKDALVALSKKYRNDPFSFVWVDAPNQAEFVAAFGLSSEQLPAVLVVKHGKRTRFAVHAGAVDVESLSNMLDNTLGGNVMFKPLKPVPELTPDYLLGTDAEEDVADE